MNITIINDCRDANAVGRQITRTTTLTGESVSFIGVQNDLEAAGCLIDTLDAVGDSRGVILVNVAPRQGKAKKWKNGTPFGYFWYKEILVVASVDGFTLSLVKKLGLTSHVNVMDIPTIVYEWIEQGILEKELGLHIIDTQFRSYDFVPRVATYLLKHKDITSVQEPIANFPDAPQAIWWVDNFGNCKTTLLKEELGGAKEITTRFGTLPYFDRLKDVPDDTQAIITGSSGIGNKRFLEIVVQGKHASQILGINSGDEISTVQ